jgi:hypothetical protein
VDILLVFQHAYFALDIDKILMVAIGVNKCRVLVLVMYKAAEYIHWWQRILLTCS